MSAGLLLNQAHRSLHVAAFSMLSAQGKLEQADLLYLKATRIKEKALGPDHPNVAAVLHNRATLLRAQVIDFPSRQRVQETNCVLVVVSITLSAWWLECSRRGARDR